MTLICKSVGIWDGIVNPIYGCGVEITQDINPTYDMLGWKGKNLVKPWAWEYFGY